jgi:hypothetical protein
VIPVARVAAPAGYGDVKKRGDAWLEAHPHVRRPKDLWSPFLSHLAEGFSHLCGYSAMLDPTGGTVDHYLSWTNYRFASHILNSSKRTADGTVLDPYEVQRGWFEIILPSLQLRVTDRIPAEHRARAEFTLKRLKLGDGEKVVRWRQLYYERYRSGQLSLEGLREIAPLVAEAVERDRRTGAREFAPSKAGAPRGARKAPREARKPSRVVRKAARVTRTGLRATAPGAQNGTVRRPKRASKQR